MGYKEKNVQINIYFGFLYVRWLVIRVGGKNLNLSCESGFLYRREN